MKQITYKERIEKLMAQWEKIKTQEQWNSWAKKVKNTKFGTYGTIPFAEVLKNTGVKYTTVCAELYFLQEIERAHNCILSN